jgi:hypothetical protein
MSRALDYFFLTTTSEGVFCHAHDTTFVVESAEALNTFLTDRAKALGLPDRHELTVMCSSSMDFPEDETDDPQLIALARKIRG